MKESPLSCKFALISCQRYTELASKRLDTELTWKERIGYKVHHLVCMACRRFNRQITLIDQVLRQGANSDLRNADDSDVTLPEAAKHRIAERIENSIKQ